MDRWEIVKQFRILATKQFNLDHENLLSAAADMLESDAREIEELQREIVGGRREIERLKLDNEILKGFVERNK